MANENRAMFRLGPGEYGTQAVKRYARAMFFRAIGQITPEVSIRLKEVVWSVVLQSYEEIVRIHGQYPKNPMGDLSLYVSLVGYAPLRDTRGFSSLLIKDFEATTDLIYSAINKWMVEFGFEDNWIGHEVLSTMHYWAGSEVNIGKWPFALGIGFTQTLHPRDTLLDFVDEGWDPQRESWKDFSRRLVQNFNAFVPHYKKRMIQLMKAKNLPRTPVKRDRAGPPELHFQWLALFQCRRMSIAGIADYYSRLGATLDESAISKAIRQVAKQVGLTLSLARRTPKRK